MNFTRVFASGVLCAALFVGGCSRESRRAAFEAKGDKYFETGDYAEAEIEYLNAAKLKNDDAHAISRLGLIYFDQGRFSRAYSFLSRAESLNPDDLQVGVKMGFLNLALGRKKEAFESATAVLNKDPKAPRAATLLAQACPVRDLNTASNRLVEIVAKTGATAETELAFGTLAARLGNHAEAQARFAHAQELDSKRADIPFARGVFNWAMNDLTNANQYLKQAADIAEPRSIERLTYADFKMKTGDADEARRILTEMTRNTPDYIPAWLSLANLELVQRNFDQCATLIQQAEARAPENFQVQLLSLRLRLTRASADKLAGKLDSADAELDKVVAEYEKLAAQFSTAPQIFFQLGVAYLAKDDLVRALRNFNQAVQLDPQYDEALLQQAQINIIKNNPEAAIISMSEMIKREPKQPTPYFVLAGAYASRNEFDNAIATCRRLEPLYTDNPRIAFVIGGFYLRENKRAEARAEFTRALKISPQYLPAMEQLVNLDLADKEYASALDRVDNVLKEHPDYADVLTLRAKVFLVQTNEVEAEKSLRKAVEANASYSPAYLMLANLYVQTGKNDAALQELNQAIAANPRDVSALTLVGMIQSQQGNDSEARASYEKLLQINPNSVIALNNLAYLYSEKFNLLDKAFDAARKCRDLAPYDPASADTLGWVVFKRGDYSWALNLLQMSADKLPDQPEVLYHLGMTYYMLNDEVRARKTLERALDIKKDFPGNEEATKRLALLSLDISHPGPEVVAALEKRLAEQPEDPIALSHLASVYQAQGRAEQAAQVYERVLNGHSDNPKLLVTLARLYSDQLNDQKKAMDLAMEAHRLAPRDADATHLLGRLVFATGQFKWALSLLQNARSDSADPGLLYDLAWAQYSLGHVKDAESSMQDALLSGPSFVRAQEAKDFLHWLELAADSSAAAKAQDQIEQALRASPNNVPVLMASAVAAESRGQTNAAIETCELILKQYPDFAPALKKLAIYYSDAPGKEQRAYDVAVKARETLGDDPDVNRVLGIAFYRRGDYPSAERLLNQVIRGGGNDARTLCYLGMTQFKLKRMSESKIALQQALSRDLSAPLADEAKKMLAEIK